MRKLAVVSLLLAMLTMLVGAAPRGYAASRYALELDGVVVGWLFSAEGGAAVGEVVGEPFGGDLVAKKHIAGVKYEDITVQVGSSMSKAFYDWIADTLAGRYTRKNGAIIVADYNNRETQRLEFQNALITEIGFPALDAASKDAAKMTIKFSPELTRNRKASGKQLPSSPASKQKQWLPANFRLRIDGLELASSRVNKIEAITVKQKVVEHAVGEMRDYVQEPGRLEIPNLIVTLPDLYADDVYKWHDDFVIRGNSSEEKEKNATLEFLSPDLKQVYFSLTFSHLGIYRLAPEKVEAGSENIRRVKAEMYCEALSFSWGVSNPR